MQKINPCLWFNGHAEEAANFYVSVFKNSRILGLNHYGEGMPLPAGTVLTVRFELDGQAFVALNGTPDFPFSPAISLVVNCASQSEVDDYWQKLSAHKEREQCGWLMDQYGVSWQIVPVALQQMLSSEDPASSQRVMTALMAMKKLDIAALQRAYDGR
ncbi:MAG: VOC family protein [Rhodoferax sp.]|nr:VOC family protein [Rhodoferax sp.]